MKPKKRIVSNEIDLRRLAKADALLQGLVNDKKVLGLSATILKQGKILLQNGYGLADLENKISVDAKKTVFRIASISKPIAATALAHIIAEGIIDLDASFYDYVPYYPKKKWDFSIRQLASHTAGIRSYQGTEYGSNKPYSIKDSIEIFQDDPLLFEPGSDYRYNSYDWVLISLAMQEASGIPFEEYVREKVLRPLGMNHTFPEKYRPKASTSVTGPAEFPHLTKFYSKNRKGFRKAIPVDNFYKLAGGGYLSTSADIAKFGQAYLEGNILNQEVLSPFLTSQTINGKPTYYGLGWQVSEDAGGKSFYGHIGNGVGGYSNFFVFPEEKVVMAILVNCTDPKVQGELDAIVQSIATEGKSKLQ